MPTTDQSTAANQAVLDATRSGKNPVTAAKAALKPAGRRANGSFSEALIPLENAIAAIRLAEQKQTGLGQALDEFNTVAAATTKAVQQQRDHIAKLIKSLGL